MVRLAIENGHAVGVYLDDGTINAKQVVWLAVRGLANFRPMIFICLCMPRSTLSGYRAAGIFTAMRPTLRIPDEQTYFKYDTGKLPLAALNWRPNPGACRNPRGFCFDALPMILHILSRFWRRPSGAFRNWAMRNNFPSTARRALQQTTVICWD